MQHARQHARKETAVVARYPSLDDARRAFLALQNHGVDAADIRLAGSEAEDSVRRVEREGPREQLDGRVLGHVAPRVALGAIVGALVGAAVGAGIAALGVAVFDLDAEPAMFVLIALAFAALAAALGAFLTFERSVGYDDTWELTLDDDSGRGVAVAVRVRDEDESIQVVSVLGRDRPPDSVEIRRATPDGMHVVRW